MFISLFALSGALAADAPPSRVCPAPAFANEAAARRWFDDFANAAYHGESGAIGSFMAPGFEAALNGRAMSRAEEIAHLLAFRAGASDISFVLSGLRVTCDGLAENHVLRYRTAGGERREIHAVSIMRFVAGRVAKIDEVAAKACLSPDGLC